MVRLDQKPESKRMISSPVAPARRTRATSSSTKRIVAARGVGRPLAQADMEHLAGVGPRGEEGVIAEHVGVAKARPALGLAAHLADGRVEVDDHLVRPGPRPERPGPAQRLGEHGVELTDVTEGEGAQERAERRRCHDPVRKHRRRRPRAQHVGVVDVASRPPPWRAPR